MPQRTAPSRSSSWTTRRRSATPFGSTWSIRGTRSRSPATGEEALAILQRQKITGILLDVNLPGTSGIDLVPRILELEPDVALLMLTAVNDATTAALCMQRGALDYLLKPIDLAHLGRAIQRALERRHTAARRPADQPVAQGGGRAPRGRAAARAGHPGADLGGHARGAGQRARGQGPLPPRALRPGGRSLGQRRGAPGRGPTRRSRRSGPRAGCTTSARSGSARRS